MEFAILFDNVLGILQSYDLRMEGISLGELCFESLVCLVCVRFLEIIYLWMKGRSCKLTQSGMRFFETFLSEEKSEKFFVPDRLFLSKKFTLRNPLQVSHPLASLLHGFKRFEGMLLVMRIHIFMENEVIFSFHPSRITSLHPPFIYSYSSFCFLSWICCILCQNMRMRIIFKESFTPSIGKL